MAGRRRNEGKPKRSEARPLRRRATLADRLARARCDHDRVAAAYAYATGALVDLARSDPQRAHQLAADLIQTLIAAGDAAGKREVTRRDL